jgi:phosphoglycerate kinase
MSNPTVIFLIFLKQKTSKTIMLNSSIMLKTINDLPVTGQRVLVRTDFDVPIENGKIMDFSRIDAAFSTFDLLLKNKARLITILCHIGRPEGRVVEALRVEPVVRYLKTKYSGVDNLFVFENLRFNPGEETNNLDFARNLASQGEFFVNDAFAVSHRRHASVFLLPSLLPSAIGLNFQKEISALDKVRLNPKPPVVFILGGAKLETKLPFIEKFLRFSDKILVGGKLVAEIKKRNIQFPDNRLILAQLSPDGLDISKASAQAFADIIRLAGTVVWNGPLGVFEQVNHQDGTRIIAQAVNDAPGYTVIGGGDTEAAATKFDAEDKIDHISLGGGAMLEYLSSGTLPGLLALKGENND